MQIQYQQFKRKNKKWVLRPTLLSGLQLYVQMGGRGGLYPETLARRSGDLKFAPFTGTISDPSTG